LIRTFSLQVPTPASLINLSEYSPSGARYAAVSPEYPPETENFFDHTTGEFGELAMLEEDNRPPVDDIAPDDFDDEVFNDEVTDLFETPPATRSSPFPPSRPAKRHRGPDPRQ